MFHLLKRSKIACDEGKMIRLYKLFVILNCVIIKYKLYLDITENSISNFIVQYIHLLCRQIYIIQVANLKLSENLV